MVYVLFSISVCGLALSTYLLARYVLHSTFRSPLSKVPAAHPSCHFSDAWIIWHRYAATENAAVLAAHRSKGRVVRIGPSEVSINFMAGGVKAFAGSFEKSDWWPRLLQRYGQLPMAAMTRHKNHAVLRRAMQPLYSNTQLRCSVDFQKVLLVVVQDSLRELGRAASSHQPINAFAIGAGAGLDACTAHFLGTQHRTATVRSEPDYVQWMWMLDADEISSFWTTELPSVVAILSRLGLVPWSKATQTLRQQTADLMLAPVRNAMLEVESGDFKAEYPLDDLEHSCPLLCDSLKSLGWETKLTLDERTCYCATELLDQITAGSANIAVAIGYCCFELSRHKDIQQALRAEIKELEQRLGHSIDAAFVSSDTLSQLDRMTLLEACLTETMRVYPPVTGQLPRRVPPGGFACDDYFIPEGVTVSTAAYNLHREASIFKDTESWNPRRWIDCSAEEQKEMRAWLWMYGSGTYQCSGLHMARHMMNMWIASVYGAFSSEIFSTEGTEPQLAGLGFPLGRDLPVMFKKL